MPAERAHGLRLVACTALALATLASAGCAMPVAAPGEGPAAVDCAERYQARERRTAQAGVRDGGPRPVPGFAWLRVDRVLAARRPPPDAPAFARWLARMSALDDFERAIERRNLRAPTPVGLDGCASVLNAQLLASPARRSEVARAARVPDDYRVTARVLGLYPLTSLVLLAGVDRLHRSMAARFERPPAAIPRHGRLHRFVPPDWSPPEEAPAQRVERDALDFPLLSSRHLQTLLRRHAPVLEVDVASQSDLIGRVRLDGTGAPRVDVSEPVVYHAVTHTVFEQRVLLQLNYVVWFPSRPRAGPLDILAGALDGLHWRVTLDADLQPLLYDSIHPCGCYHVLFPTPRLVRTEPALRYEEPPMVGPFVPTGAGPVVIRLAHRTHYIDRVSRVPAAGAGVVQRYSERPYAALRSLPDRRGGRRSLFGADGLVHASRRPERWLLWPSGVASAGAMRQMGRHAVAFVGRRHFDDADLIERYFRSAVR